MLLVGILGGPSVAGEDADVWKDLRNLVGTWQGESSRFGAVSDVTHEWEFVFQGTFLRLRTQPTPQGDGESNDLHEDVGFVSRDSDEGSFVFRQFLSEGFVNTYDVMVERGEKPFIHFGYRDTESTGGMRAQMRLVFVTSDE
jgi:hypothetical protein